MLPKDFLNAAAQCPDVVRTAQVYKELRGGRLSPKDIRDFLFATRQIEGRDALFIRYGTAFLDLLANGINP